MVRLASNPRRAAMDTSRRNTEPPQIAIWYFVGATFLFVAPTLFFPDADLWVRIVLFSGIPRDCRRSDSTRT